MRMIRCIWRGWRRIHHTEMMRRTRGWCSEKMLLTTTTTVHLMWSWTHLHWTHIMHTTHTHTYTRIIIWIGTHLMHLWHHHTIFAIATSRRRMLWHS